MTDKTGVMERLRAANPASPDRGDATELWTQIVASPGDPRLSLASARPGEARPLEARPREARPGEARGSWRRARVRRHALLACGVLAATCASAAVAKVAGVIDDPFAHLAHDKPLALFRAAPDYDARRQPPIVPGSVRLVETFSVPHVGKVAYWTARNTKGWACSAFKLPAGDWAGTLESDHSGFGGPLPSCHGPWITWEGPDFHYQAIWLNENRRQADGIVYGTVRTPGGAAAEVRDLWSGATASVLRGGYFVLIVPERRVLARTIPWMGLAPGQPRDTRAYAIPYLHLEALDRSGRVVTVAPVDRITFGH